MVTSFVCGHDGELTDRQIADRRFVRNWLYIVFMMLVAIVLVGGATRMTGSGLSITEWKPAHGIIPPVGQSQWQEEFEKYRQIAQYRHVNPDMTLAEFRYIFWWEWAHRLLARMVGFAVAVPLVCFWFTGRLEKPVKWHLAGILALGGIQGVIGWWMVASGLGDSRLTSVSHYRLAVHLVMACIIIIAVLALARGLAEYTEKPAPRSIRRFACWLVVLVLFQIYLGALVAGLHAGKVYNSWLLIDDRLIPDGLLHLQPVWVNFFENAVTVQFVHRFFAYFLLVAAVVHALNVEKTVPETTHSRRAMLLLVLILVQAVIGIVTLVLEVPVVWGLIHQAFALAVLAFAVAHWVATSGAFPASGLSPCSRPDTDPT